MSTDRERIPAQASVWLLPALMIGYFAGAQGIAMLPMLVGAVVDGLKVSDQIGGYVATVQLISSGAASLLLAARLARLNRRRLFLAGCSASLAGNLLSIAALWLHVIPLMFLSRIIDGVGQGIVIATVSAVAAGLPNPLRSFAYMNSAFAVTAGILFLLLPYTVAPLGTSGVFWLMASVAAIAATLATAIPESYQAADGETELERHSAPQAQGMAIRYWMPLTALGIFAMVTGGVWAFAERIGVNAVGLQLSEISKITAVAAFLYVAGPSMANLAGRRLGQFVPVVVGCIGYVGVALGFALCKDIWLYSLCLVSHAVICGYFLTFLSAFFADLDRSGRIVAASPAFNILGNALGPTIMAAAIRMFPAYSGIGWAATALLTCALVIFLYTIRANRSPAVRQA